MEMNWYQSGGVGGIFLIHQIIIACCALIIIAAHVYLYTTINYNWTDSIRSTLTQIVLFVFHILIAILLILLTIFGMTEPLRWFRLLGSFRGSGLVVLYLGVLTIFHLDNLFGLISGLICITCGGFYFLYGLLWRDRTSIYYKALV